VKFLRKNSLVPADVSEDKEPKEQRRKAEFHILTIWSAADDKLMTHTSVLLLPCS